MLLAAQQRQHQLARDHERDRRRGLPLDSICSSRSWPAGRLAVISRCSRAAARDDRHDAGSPDDDEDHDAGDQHAVALEDRLRRRLAGHHGRRRHGGRVRARRTFSVIVVPGRRRGRVDDAPRSADVGGDRRVVRSSPTASRRRGTRPASRAKARAASAGGTSRCRSSPGRPRRAAAARRRRGLADVGDAGRALAVGEQEDHLARAGLVLQAFAASTTPSKSAVP